VNTTVTSQARFCQNECASTDGAEAAHIRDQSVERLFET
jgi:hypothetical protein